MRHAQRITLEPVVGIIMWSFILAATQVLTVFAAASLHGAFPEVGKRFEAAHPGVSVRFDFNGSQILETQLSQGASADVFASADQRWMKAAQEDRLVGNPVLFAGNSLVIATPSTSKIRAAKDLAEPGQHIVLCADTVPCGRYARVTLENMGRDPAFGKDYPSAVLANVASNEQDVESALAKVSLGEADGTIVYRSDVAPTQSSLRVIHLPAADQPAVAYPIAVVNGSASPALAAQFVDFVRSAQGQDILRRYGFAQAP